MPAVSPFGAKLPVPALVPSTPLQLRDFDAAGLRRANRLQARQQKPSAANSRDARENARAEVSSAAAEATAAGRTLVACCSTSVTQVGISTFSIACLLGSPQPKSQCGVFQSQLYLYVTTRSHPQVETVLPSHTNMHGTAFGGTVMSWIDSCASLSASRGGRCAVVAAGFDEIAFVAPLRLGEHAVIDSKVTRSWGTSLEVILRTSSYCFLRRGAGHGQRAGRGSSVKCAPPSVHSARDVCVG